MHKTESEKSAHTFYHLQMLQSLLIILGKASYLSIAPTMSFTMYISARTMFSEM